MVYHLEDIEKIRDIESNVRLSTQKDVFDLSNWNSGNRYHNYLNQFLEVPTMNSFYNYVYSYEIDKEIHNKVREKLNIESEDKISVFFPSSTLAIVNIAVFLQKKNLKRICVLQPSYFSVDICLQSFGLNVQNLSLHYQNGRFTLPIDAITKENFDALWITSPIFCTNLYFEKSELNKINHLLNKGIYVICDESLAPLGSELNPQLVDSRYLFSIFSPHKVLGTNTMKFSCVITHKEHEDFFDIWTDLFSGGLALSSVLAINHFISENYSFTLLKSIEYINETFDKVKNLLLCHSDSFTFTRSPGIYITIFFKYVPFEESKKTIFIQKLIEHTNTSLLPGYLEGFYENFGFCFRVNLTLDPCQLLLALNKVIVYLEKMYL